jgi:hypothetical protein
MIKRHSWAAAAFVCLFALPAMAGDIMTVYRSPSCGCCGGWVDYMKAKGFAAKVVMSDDMDSVKLRQGVPPEMESCHTAVIDGYIVEGHVPVEAIAKLLAEKPKAIGIAAPGMPQGSPGMSGEKEPFTVYLFDASGAKPFMRF